LYFVIKRDRAVMARSVLGRSWKAVPGAKAGTYVFWGILGSSQCPYWMTHRSSPITWKINSRPHFLSIIEKENPRRSGFFQVVIRKYIIATCRYGIKIISYCYKPSGLNTVLKHSRTFYLLVFVRRGISNIQIMDDSISPPPVTRILLHIFDIEMEFPKQCRWVRSQ